MEKNLFEIAARKAFRFESVRGDITTEQLFDLPLTSRNGFDLDNVARTVNNQLKAVTEESFVTTTRTTGKTDLETKLDIVKFVIADRIAENEAKLLKADKAAKRAKILDALAAQEDKALTEASREDLLKQLEELDA